MESALREGGRQPGLRLIETVLWDGARAPRWPLHLARLQRSAGELGWDCPVVVPEGPAHPARLRLTLGAAGDALWEVHPLPDTQAEWRLGLALARVSSSDPWLGVKSTCRSTYDAARACLPAGLNEVIFLNERDEVCEGTICNLFFDRGQGKRTPPCPAACCPVCCALNWPVRKRF